MSINFSTLQGLTIPEGVVTQITDASGRVLWALAADDKPVVLSVEKITSTTYAGSTSYSGEQFILLNIYPKKSNSVVNVTYGGLTKTLTFSGTNAQSVYFGTFNGVSDSVTTPESGELTIEGGYSYFASCGFSTSSKNTAYCYCIRCVIDWGNIKTIAASMFNGCTGLKMTEIPEGFTDIGDSAFFGCLSSTQFTLPSTLKSIGSRAFAYMSDGMSYYGCILNTLIIRATTPPSMGSSALGDYTVSANYGPTEIVVPAGCGEVYKAAWSDYADLIREGA